MNKKINISKLKVGDKFKLTEMAHTTHNSFIYKFNYDEYKDDVFEVCKLNKTTVVANILNVGQDSTTVYFKHNKTGHWRSEGKDVLVEVITK